MGTLWLVACYTLDKCDGEIACVNAMSSKWGAYFDDFVNWLVGSAFFAALGYGVWQIDGEILWLWLGAAETIGATIDEIIDIILHRRAKNEPGKKKPLIFVNRKIPQTG